MNMTPITYPRIIGMIATSDAFDRQLEELRRQREEARPIGWCKPCGGTGMYEQFGVDEFTLCPDCGGEGVVKEVRG
jgi:ssDNA-binding Zn-finger/Zn-ribbon topoisomerase 1